MVRPNELEDEERWGVPFERLAAAVLRWTGNRAGIAEVTEAQATGMVGERRPILNELIRDAVWLFGVSVRKSLFEGSP